MAQSLSMPSNSKVRHMLNSTHPFPLTWHAHPVRFLNIFQPVHNFPLYNEVNSDAVWDAFLDDKNLHKQNTSLLIQTALRPITSSAFQARSQNFTWGLLGGPRHRREDKNRNFKETDCVGMTLISVDGDQQLITHSEINFRPTSFAALSPWSRGQVAYALQNISASSCTLNNIYS